MDLSLHGKTALVSGSTAGIGFAIAELLAKQGARVIVNGRTQARVTEAIDRIRHKAPKADVVGFAADLSSAAGVQAIAAAFPDVDILVNNLGIYDLKSFEELTDEEWTHIYDVNVMSGVRLVRAYLPRLRASNWGRIIFISSVVANVAPAYTAHYSATKAAQVVIARGLAEYLAGTQVTVNSVLVGPTETEGNQTLVANHPEFLKAVVDSTLIKRLLHADEIANVVAYLASEASSGTTGTALRVDGGAVKHI